MTIKIGIVMDPISDINIHKDSSFAMLLEAQSRGWELYYLEMQDLYLDNGRCFASSKKLKNPASPIAESVIPQAA